MTLHWTFVLYSLYLEVAFASLLMIPWISDKFARSINFLKRTLFSNKYVTTIPYVIWVFYVVLFLEALRQVNILLELHACIGLYQPPLISSNTNYY